MDIVIHRCTLRVVRRGGWSWGADPRRVVEAAAWVLPALLARRLAGVFDEAAEGELTQPVVLRVPVRLADLAAIAAEVRAAGLEAALGEEGSTAAVDAALEEAVRGLPSGLRPERFSAAPSGRGLAEASEGEAGPMEAGPSCERVLLDWRHRGSLPARLRGFSAEALELWAAALGQAPPVGAERGEANLDGLERLLSAVVLALAAAPMEGVREGELGPESLRARALRHRLIAAVEVGARLGVAPSSPGLQAAIARVLPLPGVPPETEPRRGPPVAPRPLAGEAVRPPVPTARGTARRSGGRAQEPGEQPALPWLLLGPLAQIGVLDALAVACGAADRSPDLPVLAAGLALKVLGAPERGWRRQARDLAAAATFAGLEAFPEELGPLADEPLAELASPVEAAIAHAALEAHTAGAPLVLQQVDEGLLVADSEGLFPVACGPVQAVLRLLEGTASPLFVPLGCAAPGLLTALELDGLGFVTDAPPTRGERWQRLAGAPGERFWTNRPLPVAEGARAPKPGALADLADELGACWGLLSSGRPVAPRPRHRALDRVLALSAGVALAFLAWTLWRTREPAHPRLALQRFADLEARVRVTREVVEVALPAGRRQQDLRGARLLGDVQRVPWLAGRVVHFTGG